MFLPVFNQDLHIKAARESQYSKFISKDLTATLQTKNRDKSARRERDRKDQLFSNNLDKLVSEEADSTNKVRLTSSLISPLPQHLFFSSPRSSTSPGQGGPTLSPRGARRRPRGRGPSGRRARRGPARSPSETGRRLAETRRNLHTSERRRRGRKTKVSTFSSFPTLLSSLT